MNPMFTAEAVLRPQFFRDDYQYNMNPMFTAEAVLRLVFPSFFYPFWRIRCLLRKRY